MKNRATPEELSHVAYVLEMGRGWMADLDCNEAFQESVEQWEKADAAFQLTDREWVALGARAAKKDADAIRQIPNVAEDAKNLYCDRQGCTDRVRAVMGALLPHESAPTADVASFSDEDARTVEEAVEQCGSLVGSFFGFEYLRELLFDFLKQAFKPRRNFQRAIQAVSFFSPGVELDFGTLLVVYLAEDDF